MGEILCSYVVRPILSEDGTGWERGMLKRWARSLSGFYVGIELKSMVGLASLVHFAYLDHGVAFTCRPGRGSGFKLPSSIFSPMTVAPTARRSVNVPGCYNSCLEISRQNPSSELATSQASQLKMFPSFQNKQSTKQQVQLLGLKKNFTIANNP